MAQTAAAKLVKANYDKRELKSENSDLRKEISAQKREFKKEAAMLATVGGLSATGGALAGSNLQRYLNQNYGADSKLRALTDTIPTMSIVGAVIAVAGVGFARDNTTKAVIGGFGGGLAGGAYLEGTGLA